MGQCYITRRGKANDVNMDYQYMPVMTGITGFFEPSGIDIANGVWHNAVGENDIILNGGTVENNALKFAVDEYGELEEITEPDTYYIVFQKPDVGSDNERFFGKGCTDNLYNYSRDLEMRVRNDITLLSLTKNGAPYCETIIDKLKYHVVVIANKKDINTDTTNSVLWFVDSDLIGCITENVDKGNYDKKIYINRYRRGEGTTHFPKTDTYIKMIAIGAEQSARDIIKNSEYLAKKFITEN